MRRRLLNLLPVLSLLLCVAVVAMWLAGISRARHCYWGGPTGSMYCVVSNGGRVCISGETSDPRFVQQGFRWFVSDPDIGYTTYTLGNGRLERWGFSAASGHTDTHPFWRVTFPLWAPLAATAVAPVACVIFWIRRRMRHRPGLCPTCGYDVRATPGRCPECGARTVLDAEKEVAARGP